MHAEIAAAVAREHTPGLCAADASRLEEFLGRSPMVLELEVYAALLRISGDQAGARWPLRVELGPGTAAALAVASGRGAVVEAALGLAAAGAQPLALVLGLPTRDGSGQLAAAERAEADRLGFTVVTVDTGSTAAVTGLAVGLVGGTTAGRPEPVAGDVLIYLGAPTGREGLGGTTSGGVCPPPSQATQDQTLALLRALHERPGLVRLARGLGAGGLAQAAAGLAVGVQILLDAVPRHPVLLHPKELLLAETPSRALVVVPAERVDEVLAAAQAQEVVAARIGVLTADRRLGALTRPRGATAARLVCELPLLALQREPLPPGLEPRTELRPSELSPSASAPRSEDPLLEHLRAQAGDPPQPATVLATQAALAVRWLDPDALVGNQDPSEAAGVARRALSAAVGAIYATGATPVGAAWLLGATAESLAQLTAPGAPLDVAGTDLGLAVGSASSLALPAGGLLVVLGQQPVAVSDNFGGFPGPGLLLAVLGFDAGEAAQERAAGALCSELVHAGLCAAVRPIAQGGLLLALARACAQSGVGCTAVLPVPLAVPGEGAPTAPDELVREVPGRYLLAIPAHRQADARILASDRGVPLFPLGRTGGSELILRRSDGPADNPFRQVLKVPVAALAAELAAARHRS